jgi:hypothetical protein
MICKNEKQKQKFIFIFKNKILNFRNRTGSIRLLAMKMALALLCRGNIEEKYRCKLSTK